MVNMSDKEKSPKKSTKAKKPLSIYIHVPNTRKLSDYTTFFSIENMEEKQTDAYVDALCCEISSYAKKYSKTHQVKTIFIGGGEPALLTPVQFHKITNALKDNFDTEGLEEFTVEVAPDLMSEENLAAWRSSQLPVNRLSVGIASADDIVLSVLGKSHTARGGLASLWLAHLFGFENINIDFIYGVPVPREMASAGLARDVEKEISIMLSDVPFISHISTYAIMPEEGTEILRKLEYEELYEQGEDESIDEEYTMNEVLHEHGFKRYEITSWARPGMESAHAQVYWTATKEYLGFGINAAGLIGNERYENTKDLGMYLLNPDKVAERHIRTNRDIVNDTIMMGLRTTKGVRFSELKKLGFDIIKERAGQIMELVNWEVITVTKTKIRATEEGMMVLNVLIDKLEIKEDE